MKTNDASEWEESRRKYRGFVDMEIGVTLLNQK